MTMVGVSGGRIDRINGDPVPGAWVLKLERTRVRLAGSPTFPTQRDAEAWVDFNYAALKISEPVYPDFVLR
jgi:hypothetical protein